MGVATTNTIERVAARVGALNAIRPNFQPAMDVPNGGVLLALPALFTQGLLRHTDKFFSLPSGYYGIDSIFLLLALMALARIKSVEQLRYCAPGEWGKLLGLDRIPEVKTLREKMGLLSSDEQPTKWNAELCKDWMEQYCDLEMGFYIDGHVRVYHGSQTKLPRHYVAREKLCLRATTDYWVNAMDGQPFFLVNKPVDPGLIKTLEEDIVPRLLQNVANQPSVQDLENDKYLHRFVIIFDREGYSPKLFKTLKNKRIACISYHKRPGEDWSKDEFNTQTIRLSSGEITEVQLAERGTQLSEKVWVREIRKLSESGHQTSILATDFKTDLGKIAVAMFARWSQENFFKYMRENFSLDRLVDYKIEEMPDTIKVTNPDYRKVSSEIRSKTSILNRRLASFGALNLGVEIDPAQVETFQKTKSDLQEEIFHFQTDIESLKAKRKNIEQHVLIKNLPEDQKFSRLSSQTKHLIDTIKMIAYRAETAMAHVLKEKMPSTKAEEARSLLRTIYATAADIVPGEQALTIKLHHQAHHCSDELVRHLCDTLNETNVIFPGTNLRIVYELVSGQNPPGQEV